MFQDVLDLGVDKAIQLGGFNKKTKKENPLSAEGYYLGSRDIPSKFSKSGFAKMHVLQTAEGFLGVYGKTDLDPKMAVVEIGARVRITNTGSVPTNKGNDMLKFRVQVDRADTIDVTQIAGSTDSSSSPDEEGTAAYSDVEETSLDAEESAPDEITPPRSTAPRIPATAPSAARVAQVQALLKSRNSKTV